MKPAVVYCLDDASAAQAEALAGEFELPLVAACGTDVRSSKERLRFFQAQLEQLPALAFLVAEEGLQLALIDGKSVVAIQVRFHGAGVDYRRAKGGGRSELLAKAVGLRGQRTPRVVDATAGLGVDAFVLASLGGSLTLLERVPAVTALLRDGLERSRDYASQHDAALSDILSRMQLVETDAIDYFNGLAEADSPEVIYLDPMFPERKKSAAVKKEMQLFHKLIGPDEDADQLFQTALRCASERVVVKRPRLASPLMARPPSHVIEGKRNRYDVYLTVHSSEGRASVLTSRKPVTEGEGECPHEPPSE